MLRAGFRDPVHESQGVFRAVLDALARPGTIHAIPARLDPPAPLTPELAAIALALTDGDTPVWLDPALAAGHDVAAYLRFHTGAPTTADPARAAFALVREAERCPPLADFAAGTPAYPDTSTTLVLALDRIEAGPGLRLTGPGIRGAAELALAPLPPGWPAALRENHAGFPLGVDILLAAPGRLAGLPRSTAVEG
ncbi:phosphonate C-P lyase system protein PhnH [Methylobacterium persicinum]|uniref:Alpha-D-ribose 1-methylphosphonate 5-triphosphate synthase subunit PhnH n=1 Tax=Methylobacterium persicinum TaxID=374426 RepID=A0ABU0HEV8_9HYPH|nr:phosphonate C-P lyase system protein PhnH [Methylobacterium persicinum]MDQ0440856.1 alpha-D-ribose 1-methylphosphonate 5-triphosphate synthase subunit PhnH [Methylobacterium persicinum]GJE39677.1 Alpha-D-ribose 1-methylphosphonate 5-triphosphate synthase subunit PhnH [Methylobacterium persicinum]